jgi:hypothetical protein
LFPGVFAMRVASLQELCFLDITKVPGFLARLPAPALQLYWDCAVFRRFRATKTLVRFFRGMVRTRAAFQGLRMRLFDTYALRVVPQVNPDRDLILWLSVDGQTLHFEDGELLTFAKFHATTHGGRFTVYIPDNLNWTASNQWSVCCCL